jgi:hypothetical protein
MSVGIEKGEEQTGEGAGSLFHRQDEPRREFRAPTGFRQPYLVERKALIGELTKCYEEGVNLGQILQGFVVIAQLPGSFKFSDALSHDPASLRGSALSTVEALKSKISERIKAVANKAAEHSDSSEAKRRSMQRLERQFNTMLGRLIDNERSGCAHKANALCERIESVSRELMGGPRPDLVEKIECVRLSGKALHRYSSLYLETSAEPSATIELTSARAGSPSTPQTLKHFFERLNSHTVELLNSISDYTGA